MGNRAGASAHIIVYEMLVPCAVIQFLFECLRQLAKRPGGIHAVRFDKCINKLAVKAAEFHRSENRLKGSVVDAYALVYQKFRIKFLCESESVAVRTCSERRVEGKHSRFKFFYAHAVIRASKLGAECFLIVSVIKVPDHFNKSVTLGNRKLAGFGDSSFLTGFYDDSVDYDFNRMFEGLFHLDFVLVQQINFAVDADSGKAFFADSFDYFFVCALALTDNRCKYHQFRTLFKLHDGIDHLIHRLACNRFSAHRAMRLAYAGIKQPQIVMNFRNRAHRRARIAVCGFLVDGNRR